MGIHAVWSTRVGWNTFSTGKLLFPPKFSVLVTLSPTLMIRGHYFSYIAGSLFHFLTLIKLYTWECENTAMEQKNPITEEKDFRLCSVPDKCILFFENWPYFYHRVAFLQSKFESKNNVSKVLSCGLPCWPLCQKRSVLRSTKYPNFSENLQYWRYFDPCRPYPYRPYCV